MDILKLDDLTYRYAGSSTNVITDVNASFQAGRVYGIIGRSGAGKTTLLSLISGLDTPTAGSITYLNQDLLAINRDDYRAKKIGVIFQSYNLLNNMSAVENISLSMSISSIKKADKKQYINQLLERVGLTAELGTRKILELSGGEQQRVAIARAIASDPKIIIADEPTGNLDDKTQDSIMAIFQKLAHEENKCIIIVTHSKKISQMTDELYSIKDQKLLFIN